MRRAAVIKVPERVGGEAQTSAGYREELRPLDRSQDSPTPRGLRVRRRARCQTGKPTTAIRGERPCCRRAACSGPDGPRTPTRDAIRVLLSHASSTLASALSHEKKRRRCEARSDRTTESGGRAGRPPSSHPGGQPSTQTGRFARVPADSARVVGMDLGTASRSAPGSFPGVLPLTKMCRFTGTLG